MNDLIMNEIAKNFEVVEGWTFYREYNFDQFKKDGKSICLALGYDGGYDEELDIQVYDENDNYLFSDVITLKKITVENVLEEVKKIIKKVEA